MSSFLWFYPGDEIAILGVGVVVKVSIVLFGLWLLALCSRRNPPFRHAIGVVFLGTLVGGPLVAIGFEAMDLTVASPRLFGANWGEFPASRVERQGPGILVSTGGVESSLEGGGSHGTGVEPGAEGRRISESMSASDFFREAFGLVVAVWLGGIAFGLLRFGSGLVFRRRILRRSTDLATEDPVLAESLWARLGSSRIGAIKLTDRNSSPMILGFWNPVVIFPRRLLHRFDREELEMILLHEEAHVTRYDIGVAVVQRLLMIVYWPHPLARTLSSMLSRAREELCDNYVLESSDRIKYSTVLFEVAKFLTRRTNSASGLGLGLSRWNLADRLAGVLDEKRRNLTSIDWASGVLLITFGSLLVVFASGVSAFCPKGQAALTSEQMLGQVGVTLAKKQNSWRVNAALHNLQRATMSLQEIGEVDGLAVLHEAAKSLEKRLAEVRGEEEESRRRELERRMTLYKVAVEVLLADRRLDEAMSLERALRSLAIGDSSRDDAKAIRKAVPKKNDQARALRRAAGSLKRGRRGGEARSLEVLANSLDGGRRTAQNPARRKGTNKKGRGGQRRGAKKKRAS